jgi:stage IV sporulation protein FB
MDSHKAEVGKIFGIPVVLDVTFILIAVMYGQGYLTSGDLSTVSHGLLLFAGVAGSILLHELGHAAAGSYYRVPTAHIELHGFGGLCQFARHLPPDRIANIVVSLAGPAVNLGLWLACCGIYQLLADAPESLGVITGIDRFAHLTWHIGYINYWLMILNLMPSHPLDGGSAAAHILSRFIGYDRAMRFIGYKGLAVTAWLVFEGLPSSSFMLVIAFGLLQSNMMTISTHSGPRWSRWN